MKRTFYILLFALALGTAGNAAPHHRQKAHITMNVDSTGASGSIEAVSDTSSVADDDDAAWAGADDDEADDDDSVAVSVNGQQFNPAHYGNPISYFGSLWGLGVGGIMLALFIMAIILIILLLPVILLILILRYLIKRHNDRVDMQREAYARYNAQQYETGAQQGATEAPQNDAAPEYETSGTTAQGPRTKNRFISPDNIADEETWRSGVKNMTVGLGLLLASLCWGSWTLAGVAVFIVCLGGGKAFIGMTSRRKDPRNDSHKSDKQ